MRYFLVLLILLSLGARRGSAQTISNEALLAYATTPYETADVSHVSLGQNGDGIVVADFICSDVCPNYTVRVVHYDAPTNKTCAAIGGIERSVTIPVSIAATDKLFCFPKIIADNWDQYSAAAHIRMRR